MSAKRLLVLALAVSTIAVALPATGTVHAAGGCLASSAALFAEVRPEGALPGFPGWELATGLANDRIPMTPTALALRDGATCDLTRGLDAFLGEKASPASAEEALDTSLLVVHALWLDVLPNPVLLPALGLDAEAPVVTAVPGGFVAEFTAWSAFRGHVARFTVTLDGSVEAGFVVLDHLVGPFGAEEQHGWLLYPGQKETALQPGGDAPLDATKVLLGTNGDGTQWRVTYDTSRYTSVAQADFYADMHLRGALDAFATEYAWGFRSTDPDRILDLTLDGCDCIYAGHQANIHMFPRPNDILGLLPGLAYPNDEFSVGRLIVGHELFHHFQYGIQQWRMGNWMTEGQARFSETAHVPDDTFAPTTLTYWEQYDNGMNGYLARPNRGVSGHSYDYALMWGWLYKHDGGMALIKRALEETRTGGTSPDVDGVAAINRALAAMPATTHADFAHASDAMAVATITHEGWTWGKVDGSDARDWSTFFRPTARVVPAPIPAQVPVPPELGALGVGARQGAVALNGFECVNAKPAGGAAVAALAQHDPTTNVHLLTRGASGWADQFPAPHATATEVTDGVVCLTRSAVATGPAPVLPATSGGQYRVVVAAV